MVRPKPMGIGRGQKPAKIFYSMVAKITKRIGDPLAAEAREAILAIN